MSIYMVAFRGGMPLAARRRWMATLDGAPAVCEQRRASESGCRVVPVKSHGVRRPDAYAFTITSHAPRSSLGVP